MHDVANKEFKVGDRITRANTQAFRYSKGYGTIVEIIDGYRAKIKWDEKQRTGQQHSTIRFEFLIKLS